MNICIINIDYQPQYIGGIKIKPELQWFNRYV